LTEREPAYFANHARRVRFPWSLYHRELLGRLARAAGEHGPAPRILVVGCGLEPLVEGAPPAADCHGCDLDARAIERCLALFPSMRGRLAVCPSPYALPTGGSFDAPFDLVIAKEVVEHVERPAAWAQALAARVGVGGELLLTTPNYGRFSTLPLIERTVLELIARRDGYSRRHIHPSKFDRARLAALDVGPGMRLRSVASTLTGWSLLGRWQRETPAPGAVSGRTA
jgi:SAM-dependent methyltransferase